VPLVYACIAPHASELVPAFSGTKGRLFSATRSAMRALAKEMSEARPQTIVVSTPHNLRMPKHIGVVTSEYTSGKLSEGGRTVSLRAKCDVRLAADVVEACEEAGLPVVGANYGALSGPLSDLAMDWGSLIPLWFFLRPRKDVKVVIVTPARGIPIGQNYEFGRVVAEVASESRRRVAFVASADQAHAHSKKGPYGFSREAEAYDRLVRRAVEEGELASLMKLSPEFVERAKPDSLWQMTMLAGAASVVPMRGRLLSYQVPTYFGMLCASYAPVGSAG
jgi:aromatic ring-opening dioxygenase LigB subunit